MTSFFYIALIAPFLVERVFSKSQTFTRNGYTLVFDDETNKFNANTKTRMVNTFFVVYPKEAATYNKASPKRVTFIIDPNFRGVAWTYGKTVRFDPTYFAKYPKDIDQVTHEVMHIVQAYPSTAPWWAEQGIADYVRYAMGVDNKGAGWSLVPYNPSRPDLTYSNSPVAAHFILWMEKNVKKGLVKAFDKALRNGQHDAFFERFTGKTLEQLWQQYTKRFPAGTPSTRLGPPPPPG